MNLQDFAKRADVLIAIADKVIPTFTVSAYGIQHDAETYAGLRSAGLSFLRNTFGSEHPFYEEFDRQTKSAYQSHAKAARGVLVQAKAEVLGGWTVTARGILSAEIFGDFLDMANYLLSEKYKDAAAVMIGSVLEEHLRQLARKNGVAVETTVGGKLIPKKADLLNADLAKAAVYGVLQQKSVTAWLDLRNRAAHGKYQEYPQKSVELMSQGVTQFMAQYPA